MTFASLADKVLYANVVWYVLLCLLFAGAGNLGKTLYFAGATILTIGVLLL